MSSGPFLMNMRKFHGDPLNKMFTLFPVLSKMYEIMQHIYLKTEPEISNSAALIFTKLSNFMVRFIVLRAISLKCYFADCVLN